MDRSASAEGLTKSGEVRTFKPAAAVMQRLVEHIATYSDPTDPDAVVFTNDDRVPLTVASYNARFKRWAKHAGLPAHLSPNDLRHSFAAWSIGLGANVHSVQRMMGHTTPVQTLNTYGSLFQSQHDALTDRMDEALGEVEELRPAVGQVVPLR